MKTEESALWFCAKIKAIRTEAGHDVKKLEALAQSPELVAEAAARFPDDPFLAAQVRTAIELELPLARRGIFLLDGPPTDEQIAELHRQNK
ncbi:hypothetical protein F0U62_23520 [Cystobacter fuscus]|uniref:hypothetical protein n=1 Tax=Cystobacter fuscus TaxID=43 RepID=UPI002B29B3A2|nr:hypothetical protein F0U62_23520 [Cystobacter fuscus]